MIMKKYIYLFLIFWSCNIIEYTPQEIENFIPVKSSIIIKINNLGKFKSDIANNELLLKVSKLDSKYNFKSQLGLINNFNDNSEILICLSNISNENVFTVITKDSASNHKLYHKSINGINIYSNSLTNVNGITARVDDKYNKYKKTFNKNSSFSVILNDSLGKEFIDAGFNSDFENNKHSIGFGVDLFNNKILLNGLIFIDDSTKVSNNVFQGSTSGQLKNYQIAPKNSNSLKSFNFTNSNNYLKNKKLDIQNEDEYSKILNENSSEVSRLIINDNEVFIIKSNNIELFNNYLSRNKNINSAYRGFNIYSNNNLKINPFISLVNFKNKKKILIFKDHIVFSDNEGVLKNIVNENLNGNTLEKNENFNNSLSEISNYSTLNYNSFSASNYNIFEELNILNTSHDFSESCFQLAQDNGIIHFNAVISRPQSTKDSAKLTKQFDVKIDEEILMNPHFVKNHITKKLDIVVQDIKNNLYLISNKGKVIWKRNIGSPILGKILQIDLYKNGRLQLIFNTKNKIYVLDRNGNQVTPFPKNFKDPITLPISVFDYDVNKSYRILVTQGSELLMFDKKGKKVNGFKYLESRDQITSTAKHFRVLNKDFIVFKTGNKLKILNRRGKERIKVKGEINFSEQDIFKLNNKLTTSTHDQKLIQIAVNGDLSSTELNNSKNLRLYIYKNNTLILDENELKLNSKSIDMPFSNYNMPSIKEINNKLLISLFDTQNNKSYLFDKNLKLLSSFPIYSLIPTEIGDMNSDKKIEIIISNKNKTISTYTIN